MAVKYVYLAVLLFSAVMGFIQLKALRSRQLTIFAPYLALVFIQELCLHIYTQQNPGSSSAVVYNIYRPVSTSIFALFYYRIPVNSSFRKVVLALLFTYLAATLITFGFIQSLYTYNNYLYLGGGLIITFCGVFFLFNYFKLDSPAEERKWLPVLWITIGVVTFYPVVNISFALYKHLQGYRATIFGLKLYQVIPQLMSIFLYGCFAWAFYLCKRKNWT